MAAIVDGYHNGYGFQRIWLATSKGTLYLYNCGTGEYEITILKEPPADLEMNAKAGAALREMIDAGLYDDGCLQLFEGDARIPEITEILKAGGFGRPWTLDTDDGQLISPDGEKN